MQRFFIDVGNSGVYNNKERYFKNKSKFNTNRNLATAFQKCYIIFLTPALDNRFS